MARYFGVALRNGLPIGLGSVIALGNAGGGVAPPSPPSTVEYLVVAGGGGSGIVIVRYADTFAAAVSTTGSPTVTVAGGYRVYTFTSSGSITW